jgi:hypothetical protein
MSIITTSCVHLRSLHVISSATDLGNVCFLEAVLPEKKLQSNFISLAKADFVQIQTADISYSAVLCFAYEFIRTMTFHSSEMKQELIHRNKFICYANVTAESAA